MRKTFLSYGSIFGVLAVMLGAMGAHALKNQISPEQLISYETGVKYQMYHAFALLIIALLMDKLDNKLLQYSGYFFIAGVFLFSGSVYLLSLKNILGIESWTFLGPITPLGGVCFITGWIFILLATIKLKV
jgi:uncharacterized membrane protein YgdD (TMEM256/DUF423 family)